MNERGRDGLPHPRLMAVTEPPAGPVADAATPTFDEVAADLAASDRRIDAFLSTFPPAVRAEVINGMYFDGDGEPRTTYRMLRDAADAPAEVEHGPWLPVEDDRY